MPTPAELAAATVEITQKPKSAIETETARKWCARACAAYAQYMTDRDTHWLNDATEYAHEAIEHAASAEPGVLADIQTNVTASRRAALGW